MFANLIVVGGPISVGKSTLVTSLPFPQIDELNPDNKIQMLLLENTYNKSRVDGEVIENYFLQLRKEKYIEFSHTLQTHVLDRSIFESLWFAKGNLSEKTYAYFKKLWISEIEELISKEGKPKLYILLTMNWDTFKDRIFNRGREVEINNFAANEDFFKKHIAEYEEHMVRVFEMFDINYVKIHTDNLNTKEVLDEALKQLEARNV